MGRGFPAWAALVAMVTGGLVLVGWAFEIAALKSVWPGWVSMKPNAAVAFILTGLALLSVTYSTTVWSRFSRLCGWLAGLIGLLTLSEYLGDWCPGIDQWLFPEPAGTVGTNIPGRMALDTALCFVLLAIGLELARSASQRKRSLIASIVIGIMVATMALAALLTYFVPVLGAYGWSGLTVMAVPTGIGFLVLGLATVQVAWQKSRTGWGLGGKTTATYICGLVLMVLIGLNTSRSVIWLAESARRVTHAEQVVSALTSVLAEATKAQTHTRGYVITGEDRYLQSQRTATLHCREELATLRQLITDPHQQVRRIQLAAQVNAVLQWFPQVSEARRTGVAADAQRDLVNHGEDLMDNLRALIAEMEASEQQLLQERQRKAANVARFTHAVIYTGMTVSLIIFVAVLLRLNFTMTERDRIQQTLRDEQDLVLALMENLPDYIYFKDTTGRFLRINPALAKFFGLSDPAQAIGKTDADFLPAERARQTLADEQEIVRTGQPLVEIEEKTSRSDGSESWELTTKLARRAGTGRIIGICGISSDITARKRAEQALHESTVELQHKNSELERFLYAASHDLKSPVVTVRTFLGYLEQDIVTANAGQIAKDLNFIRLATDKMARLLDDLLEISRIGRLVGMPVRVPFRAVVDDALGVVAGRIAARGVTVEVTGHDVPLVGDRARLAEVFQNLIDNACKFMGEQPAPRIEIGVETRKAELVFFVRDNGIGIDPRHRSKVFDLFEKLDPKAEGTGIGLALVKRIVELYRGRIWVESAGLGQGACFYFTLPAVFDKIDAGEKYERRTDCDFAGGR